MSTPIQCAISSKLSEEFLKNIKIISVFGQKTSEVLVVSKDDECYGFGENDWGVLGFGHNIQVDEPKLIEELCFKKIINFSYGLNFVIALTINGKVFSWGRNDYGQLGHGSMNNYFNKPLMIEVLSNENISTICCGSHHSIALTEKGEVYAWGQNRLGQIGNGEKCTEELKPIKINIYDEHRIIAISCGSDHSITLSENGGLYGWGSNKYGQLGVSKERLVCYSPTFIKISENKNELAFKKVSCGPYYSLILSTHGDVFGFGSNKYGQLGTGQAGRTGLQSQYIPSKIDSAKKFIDIATHRIHNISVALSNDGVYHVWGYCREEKITSPKETLYHSINTVFLSYKNITYRVIDNDFKSNSDSLLESKDEGEFLQKFEEFEIISYGSSGIVSKAKNKLADEICAIKKTAIDDKFTDFVMRELQIMSQLKSDFVVNLKSAWVEPNYLSEKGYDVNKHSKVPEKHPVFDKNNKFLLHIQMELCGATLEEMISWMKNDLNDNQSEIISPLGYYVASESLVEILECVNYLHKHNPPIIHRDIKPSNIMITNGKNGRFLRLADFGLATTHESKKQPHTEDIGTPKYVAPEVISSKYYDTKADIYSLGFVVQDLFWLDFNRLN
jgi:alpha-tubulin suppressor-like RCC1 family protein